ncbi:hypothetical protein BGX26_003331 [Mortierella sp. AD094]|nr:hypothetical protein BGX26_003331 [Mortierella sp. AD094]
MTLSKSNEARSSVLNSPSAKAKRRKDSREKPLVTDLESEPTAENLEASLDEEIEESQDEACIEGQEQVEEENEEAEEKVADLDDGEEAALEHSDQESPFLVAQHIHQDLVPQFAELKTKRHSDLDAGLNTQTPTRPRIRGNPINLFRHGRPITRSMRTEQNDLVLVELEDDNKNVPRIRKFENKPSGLISENQSLDLVESLTDDDHDEEDTTERVDNVSDNDDGDDSNRIDDEDDAISLPKTPSKPRRQATLDLEGLTPSESGSPSTPNTPGSWLGRWKYNIMMSHSSMEPPKLTETDSEDQSADTSSVLSFEVASPEQDRILATPTRKRTKLDLLLSQATVDSESSNDESSDYEELVNPVHQGVKRRSGDGDDEYGYDFDDDNDDEYDREEEKEDKNSDWPGQPESDLSAERKQSRLPTGRLPLASMRHGQQLQSSSPFYTPPSKRPSTDLSDLKPPRAPVLSIGKLPMYRPNGVSSSPSQRRARPLSFYDLPS